MHDLFGLVVAGFAGVEPDAETQPQYMLKPVAAFCKGHVRWLVFFGGPQMSSSRTYFGPLLPPIVQVGSFPWVLVPIGRSRKAGPSAPLRNAPLRMTPLNKMEARCAISSALSRDSKSAVFNGLFGLVVPCFAGVWPDVET